MRYVLWFTVGFAAACACFAYLMLGGFLIPLGIGLLCAGLLGIFLLKKENWLRVLAVVVLGAAVAFVWCGVFRVWRLAQAERLNGTNRQLTVTVTDYHSRETIRAFVPAELKLDGRRYKVLVYLYDGLDLKPGDSLTSDFYLRYTATGENQAPIHYRGEGYFLLLYPNEDCKVTPGSLQLRFLPAELRHRLLQILEDSFPDAAVGFAKALLLGETDALSYAEDSALKLSGIRHVVAVSGLHISIVYSLVYFVSLHRRKMTVFLGIPLLFLFAAVAGFTPSVMRACIMQTIMLLSVLMRKEHDPPTALSIAALILLAVNPLTISSVGFQLSVASVAGIFLLYKRISDRMNDSVWTELFLRKPIAVKVMRYGIGSIAVSLSASLFTIPLCAYYFGVVSLIGILTNLLCMWAITILFYGIGLTGILGFFSAPLASALGWLLSWPIRGILWLAEVMSKMPLSAVYSHNFGIVLWLVISYAFLLVYLMGKWRYNTHPVWYSCVILFCVILVTWIRPMTEDFRCTVLDVGQGQCILLQSNGRTVMVDCGGDDDAAAADTAAAQLANMGIRKLDGLIITHYDRDHAGGARHLMTRIWVDTLYLPDASDGGALEVDLRNAPHGRTITVENDMLLTWQETKLQIFAPESGKSGNESSLCVLFQKEKCDILITGDLDTQGEMQLLASRPLPDLEYLVAGHHGADSSTGVRLLEATKPDMVLISVGADNRYGHPHQKTLMLLQQWQIPVRRTDKEGTITIRR